MFPRPIHTAPQQRQVSEEGGGEEWRIVGGALCLAGVRKSRKKCFLAPFATVCFTFNDIPPAPAPHKTAYLPGLRHFTGKSVTRSLAQPPWALGSVPPPCRHRRTERHEKEVRVWKEAQRVSGGETNARSR
ncbi:hypothetical protein E2C01_046096 [Portunus trituberculatus]|uniref:Uncharacterized protein n=1 Tax=Portunus trituberculatus TaxID=210409 RepID=A0A5B7G4P0_PORTR|nr:hypothetical protein [Portunus trituberculatus]